MYKQFHLEFKKLKFAENTQIFLAISGGMDSMVLTYLLKHYNIQHTLLHCNFQLRGNESDEDEIFVEKYAHDNNIQFKSISFNTKQISEEKKITIQECARNLRYDWFKTFLKDNNSVLLTAHHLDDSIETFFINLLRGTGIKGLSGISNGENKIYRPLLPFTKENIKNFVTNNRINYREDSSNSSDNYLRNNLRHHFIPEFKKLTTNFESKINTLYTELKETNNFIEEFISEVKTTLDKENRIAKKDLARIPEFMWPRLFSSFGVSRKNIKELIKILASPVGRIFETSTHVLLNDRDYLIVSNQESSNSLLNYKVDKDLTNLNTKNQVFNFDLITDLKKIKFKKNIAFLDYDNLTFPLTIRNWEQGDKMQPLGMQGRKLISDILINNKLNLFEKKKQIVIESNNQIIWLADLVVSNHVSITDKTKNVLKIEHIQY